MVRLGFRTLLFILVCLLAACAAPAYDDQADRLATQLQTDVETEITALITLDQEIQELAGQPGAASKAALAKYQAAANWAANMGAYDKIAVDLVLLRSRTAAVRDWGTGLVLRSIDLLDENLVGASSSMRALHRRDGVLGLKTLEEINGIVGPELDALIAVEAQLKAGQSLGNSSASTKVDAGTRAAPGGKHR